MILHGDIAVLGTFRSTFVCMTVFVFKSLASLTVDVKKCYEVLKMNLNDHASRLEQIFGDVDLAGHFERCRGNSLS